MPNANTRYLALPIALLCVILLVAIRANAIWTGGTGKVTPCPTQLMGTDVYETVERGEVMSTDSAGYAKYRLCDGSVLHLDANTQVRLEQYPNAAAQQLTKLVLLQGRMIVDGSAEVTARNVSVTSAGSGCELVHYSWRDELDVTSLAAGGCSVTGGPEAPEKQTTRLNTVNGEVLSVSPFSPSTSSASSFYKRTGLQLETLR